MNVSKGGRSPMSCASSRLRTGARSTGSPVASENTRGPVVYVVKGDRATLRVSDTGIGISPEDRAKLFWENKGKTLGSIGMDLTPPGYKHGQGVFVAGASILAKKDAEVHRVGEFWGRAETAVLRVKVAAELLDRLVQQATQCVSTIAPSHWR